MRTESEPLVFARSGTLPDVECWDKNVEAVILVKYQRQAGAAWSAAFVLESLTPGVQCPQCHIRAAQHAEDASGELQRPCGSSRR